MDNLEYWAVTQGYDPNKDYAPSAPSLPDGYVSKHFRQAEFTCNHCGKLHPTNATPPPLVLEWLEKIRSRFGNKPVNINSGYRCEHWNTQVGGAKNSYHLQGQAVDFWIDGVSPRLVYDYADTLIGNSGGVGKYQTFTHIDNRGWKSRW